MTHPFFEARRFLLETQNDYEKAYRGFRWPVLDRFNWALDWFDTYAQGNTRTALWLEREGEPSVRHSFAALAEKSARVANFFQRQGLKKGDRILLLLPNVSALWETVLGALKVGAVLVPTSVQASPGDLLDRLQRGQIKMVLTDTDGAAKFDSLPGDYLRCIVGARAGWVSFGESERETSDFSPQAPTLATDPCLLYFTSGTTAKPKLVLHTHQSYPVGHLSTMYWIGVREGDTHQNFSSPGWAKHAWSSFFAPWNAGATIFVHEPRRFQAAPAIQWLRDARVNTLCAPPTVWRMLIQENLSDCPAALREAVSAGEPLNAKIIETVRAAWGITIRDGYGQTETTAQIGNTVGTALKPGSMGRPLPGYQVELLDGEIALKLSPRPLGLMEGYLDDPQLTRAAMSGGFYRTGDEASIDEDGYFHFIGRGDDVFKSSDYRISPFELESVLLEHRAVAEAAIVPSPDPIRHCVPKAFVVLKSGVSPDAITAKSVLDATNAKMAGYKRIRKIEFCELPKTISGKIRRVQLRDLEKERVENESRGHSEFWLEELQPVKG